jgi:class 3 adenylate cyclase/CHASE2 domain-containing sensor protein
MADKTKTKTVSNKKLYAGTLAFSLVWFLFCGVQELTRRIDFNWDHFILNLPAVVAQNVPLMEKLIEPGDTFGNRLLYGKYITKPANPKISIAAIDDYSLDQYGWPVPRNLYGDMIEKLNRLGAKAIVFDVIVTASKRDKAADNIRFITATAKAGNVSNLIVNESGTDNIKYPIKGLAEASAIMSHPHVDTLLDSDGQVRRYMPYWVKDKYADPIEYRTFGQTELKTTAMGKEFPDLPIPSLGVAGLSFYSGKHVSQLFYEYNHKAVSEGSEIQGKTLRYRNYVQRVKHPAWNKRLDDVTSSAFRHISFADILSGQLTKEEKEAIKDGILLVGSTAVGAFDHSPGPFSSQMPGVEVHATFIDNAVAGDFIEPLFGAWVMLLILLLPWVPVYLRKYSMPVLISSGTGILLFLAVGYVVLLANGTQMPFATVSLAFFLPFTYITVDKGLAEGREKKWIKNTFGQYLSPKVVEMITKDPSRLSLGGEKRDMTAFFLDLAGFTTMSEKLSPEELTSMLVEYLSAFTDVILKYDGTVDKYIGDCVVAFWNAPLDQADHRKLGVMAAIDCQKAMTRLNESLTQFTIKPKCRVGVNSGPMVVGNMGSRSRLSYTVMGDSVNMASRMEGANKYFHSKIMTSEHTFGEIKEYFDYRYLGSIRVVGKAIPTKVYEPFAMKGEAEPEVKTMLGHYMAGIEKFYKGDYAGSLPDFKAALAALPGDGPAQFYVDNAEKFSKEPPKDWDQSFNLTEKG